MESIIELLSDSERAQIVIQSIASYIRYIYPGIISLNFMYFLEARTTKLTSAYIAKCFSVGYVYNLLLGQFVQYEKKVILYNIILILSSAILPFIWYKIKYSTLARNLCEKVGIRTCLSSVPFELLKDEEEQYTCIKVYLNDDITSYIGFMGQYEYDISLERFIILTGYRKYILGEDGDEREVIANTSDRYNEKVYIKLDNVKMIEKCSIERAMMEIYNYTESIDLKKDFALCLKKMKKKAKRLDGISSFGNVKACIESYIEKYEPQEQIFFVQSLIAFCEARSVRQDGTYLGVAVAILIGGAAMLGDGVAENELKISTGVILIICSMICVILPALAWRIFDSFDKTKFLLSVLNFKLEELKAQKNIE